jgi:hypothetical protein
VQQMWAWEWVRHDTGNPQVYFVVPIPVPANTVPPAGTVMMLGQDNQTKHLNVCLVQHRLEEGSEVV